MIVYDEAHITLHDHYTNGVECVGPENVENKEENCEAGDCLDKICGKTIEFPTGVYQYTTICHQCTPLFSKSSEFSESFKFTFSNVFSKLDYTFSSLEISSPNDDSSFETSEPEIVDDPGKQGSEEKRTNKVMIGSIVG